MTHRPSSLPMLAKCPLFKSGTSSDFAEEGTSRHALLSRALKGEIITEDAELDDLEAIEWARDYILLHAPTSNYPLQIETKRQWLGPDFEEREGTPDVVCGNHVFDFKWRHRDYVAQMADYACSVFDENPKIQTVHCHLLFGATKKSEKLEFTHEEALTIVAGILNNPSKTPLPNEYCGWCAHRLTCSAFIATANRVIENRKDWELSTFHASEINTPEEMGIALRIARQLGKWCEAVEHFAKDMCVKQGATPIGFEKKETSGRKYVTDCVAAFQTLGITQEAFLKCCEPRMNTSKEYPDKVGLVEAYASAKELKKATAKREIETKLGDIIKRGKDGFKLMAKGEEDSDV